jgi:hypothetical protein
METPDKPKYLLVSIDDEDFGHPVFCNDEAAVREALAPRLYFFNAEYPLSEEDNESIDDNLAALFENGVMHFEGDPSIYLFKLHQE